MKRMIIFLILATFLVGCGPSRIDSDYRLRGLTKKRKVKNNLSRINRGKKLKAVFSKIMDPEW